ncbi:hypothetical protein F3Y22_tig00111427pilonHSYRG00684 [Hibiscus syriacus]|uniref:Uncharacterized protein n=1 Tax=Hibiscus syriacus TaxID=106335 RepID=A0A6A2YK95_HIBSY|nr:hypothetical protein F3Y22_tig00111427pilonHSYRG00684 [Hibiscus syriacus]
MESMGGKIVGGVDDFEIEAETRKQPKGGYTYFYMTECQMMKEDGEHIGSNSMSDADKEPYIAQSKMDSEEYKEWRKAHEKKIFIKLVNTCLGVGNEGKSAVKVSKSKIWKALASKYGLKQKVTYAELEEEIKSLKGEFNWDEYVHSRLIESIITFKKGSQRNLKGCITILEVALFNFWSGCEAVPTYEITGMARIRSWGKKEVVKVMAKLKLDKPRKQERVIGKEVEEAEEKKEEMTVRGMKGEIKEIKSYVEQKYDELKKYEEEKMEEEKKMEEEENMEEMRRKDVDVIYTPESVIDADLDSEYPAPQKKKLKKRIFQAELMTSKLQFVIIYGIVIDLLAWTVCYDSKKSLRRIDYLPYHLAQHALNANNKVRVEDIASFWGPILGNYVKFTDREKMESIGSTGATGDFVVGQWDRL